MAKRPLLMGWVAWLFFAAGGRTMNLVRQDAEGDLVNGGTTATVFGGLPVLLPD